MREEEAFGCCAFRLWQVHCACRLVIYLYCFAFACSAVLTILSRLCGDDTPSEWPFVSISFSFVSANTTEKSGLYDAVAVARMLTRLSPSSMVERGGAATCGYFDNDVPAGMYMYVYCAHSLLLLR